MQSARMGRASVRCLAHAGRFQKRSLAQLATFKTPKVDNEPNVSTVLLSTVTRSIQD